MENNKVTLFAISKDFEVYELISLMKEDFLKLKENFKLKDEEYKYIVAVQLGWVQAVIHSYYYYKYDFLNPNLKPSYPKEGIFRFTDNSITEDWNQKWNDKILKIKFTNEETFEHTITLENIKSGPSTVQKIAIVLKKLNSLKEPVSEDDFRLIK